MKIRHKVSDIFGKGKKGGKDKLPDGMEYYYKFQMFVKDQTNQSDSNLYIVFLCSVEGRGKEFLKIDLGKEKPEESHYKELKKIYKSITKPNVTLDLMVEAVQVSGSQPVFFVVDTELTI